MAARRGMMALRSLRLRSQAAVAKPSEQELATLLEKQKLPWGQLSVQEKTQLYRAAYGKSRVELMSGDGDGTTVAMGVLGLLGVSWLVWTGLQSLAEAKPKTINKEWQRATVQKAKESGANPEI